MTVAEEIVCGKVTTSSNIYVGFHLGGGWGGGGGGGGGGGIRPPLESLCPPLAFSHSLLYSTVK